MMFVVYHFHQHRLLTLKCVLLLTADTNSATMISNSFIPPIKLKHCLRKCVHASNLSCQILWARSVSFPAVTNIRSTTGQRHWQSPTHSINLTCVVMHQVWVKTTCDMTRITHDSLIFSSFLLPPQQKWTSGGGTVHDSGQRHTFFSHLAASLKDQYKVDIYTKLVLFLLLPLRTNTKLTFRQNWCCFNYFPRGPVQSWHLDKAGVVSIASLRDQYKVDL